MKEKLLEYLSSFGDITQEIEEAISENSIFKEFKKGDILLKEGESCKECYFIIAGCIRAFSLSEGNEQTIEFYTPEQSLIPASYGTSSPSEYFLDCLTDTIVSVGNPELEQDTFKKFPQLESLSRKIAESILVKQQEIFRDFKSSTPTERYLAVLKEKPFIIQIAPQHQLASYLGITPESLSRIRKRLADKR